MLQKYDSRKYFLALALAGLGSAPFANAVTLTADAANCTAADGFSLDVSEFHSEAASCLSQPMSGPELDMAVGLTAVSNAHRAELGLQPLASRASLDGVARLHAMELAATADPRHDDQHGRSHLDRLRTFDRSGIYGATGANIVVLPAGSSPLDALAAFTSDAVNAENLGRSTFSHSGVGVVEADSGEICVVQLFAKLDGEFGQPIPFSLVGPISISADLHDADFQQTGWRLKANDQVLRRASGDTLRPPLQSRGTAMIEIEAEMGTATYRLKGPAVTIQ